MLMFIHEQVSPAETVSVLAMVSLTVPTDVDYLKRNNNKTCVFKPACLLSVYTLWPVSSCRRQTRRVNFRTHACRRKLVMGLIFPCSFFPTETQQRHTHTAQISLQVGLTVILYGGIAT